MQHVGRKIVINSLPGNLDLGFLETTGLIRFGL
jgi:hypothetical protein